MREFPFVFIGFLIVIFGVALGIVYASSNEESLRKRCLENNSDYSLADREQRCNQALTLFLDKKPNSN